VAKQKEDVLTVDLIQPGQGVVRQRGRPVTGTAMSAAERKRKSREKAGVRALAVDLPVDLIEALDRYRLGKDVTLAQVIEKLLRSQLLRPR
jgi:hypothetical protein